jgi:calcium/calmodulin-dependent protein kinase I
MGVITYFLLAGYTPFDRDSQQAEMEAIVRGDYSFTPVEYWANVSDVAKDFVRTCLTVDPRKRPTAAEALEHKWLKMDEDFFVPDPDREGAPKDLLPNVKRAFDAKQLWRKAASTIKAVNRMTLLAHPEAGSLQALRANVAQYKEESALETLESATVTYAADGGSENGDDSEKEGKDAKTNAKEDGRPPPPDKESVIMPPPKAN